MSDKPETYSDDTATEWYRRHRPRRFSDVLGQETVVKQLLRMVKTDSVPHAIMFVGNSGVGKTTLARILQKKLLCSDRDFCEINAADTRGIDTVRDIRRAIGLAPVGGQSRIWLIDECFHGSTLVSTPEGSRPIRDLEKGDSVFNINGSATIKNIFQNRVELERIIRLVFDDGTIIHTTKQHEFLTESGWVEAQNLESSHCILCLPGYTMASRPEENPDNADLCLLQKGIHQKAPREAPAMLLEAVRTETSPESDGQRTVGRADLSGMLEAVHVAEVSSESVLRTVLCGEEQNQKTRIPSNTVQREHTEEDQYSPQETPPDRAREGDRSKIVREDDCEESVVESRDSQKGKGHEGSSWLSARLEGRTRGQRKTDRTPKETTRATEQDRCRMEDGTAYPDKENPTGRSLQLQSRSREQGSENRDRNRWERTSDEKGYLERCQKDRLSRSVRLVHSEVYEQGCNDSSFGGIISDTDRRRGFAVFYDLEIEGHPSYFAQQLPVHNCHKITGDAQTALLKILEDAPRHAYFILATTDPNKVIKTIHTRCTTFTLESVGTTVLEQLVRSVAEKEKVSPPLSDAVVTALAESAEGSPRKALVTLQEVCLLDKEEDRLNAIQPPEVKRIAMDLVRLLVWGKPSWEKVRMMLLEIKEDPEGLRRLIMANARIELLKPKGNYERAAAVLAEFGKPFYDCAPAQLAAACYEVFRGLE